MKRLSVEGRKKFYEECSRQLAKGNARQTAIVAALKKVGIEDLWKVNL